MDEKMLKVSDCLKSGDLFRVMEVGKPSSSMRAFQLRAGVLSNDAEYDPMTFYFGSTTFRKSAKKFNFAGLSVLHGSLIRWTARDWFNWLIGSAKLRVYEWREGVVTELFESDIPEAWIFARSTVLAVKQCEKVGLVVQSRRIVKPNKSLRNGRVAS